MVIRLTTVNTFHIILDYLIENVSCHFFFCVWSELNNEEHSKNLTDICSQVEKLPPKHIPQNTMVSGTTPNSNLNYISMSEPFHFYFLIFSFLIKILTKGMSKFYFLHQAFPNGDSSSFSEFSQQVLCGHKLGIHQSPIHYGSFSTCLYPSCSIHT